MTAVSPTGCWIRRCVAFPRVNVMDTASSMLSPDLNTPAGRVLRELVRLLPKDRLFTITVFGSAPIQIMVDPNLLSADVDVFSPADDLPDVVHAAGLDREQTDFYVQVSS